MSKDVRGIRSAAPGFRAAAGLRGLLTALVAVWAGLVAGCASQPAPPVASSPLLRRAPAETQASQKLAFANDVEVAAAEKRMALGPLVVLRHPDVVNRVAFGPGDTRLAVGGVTGDIRVWDIRGVWQGESSPAPLRLRMASSVNDIAFAPDGTLVAVTDVASEPLKLWTASGVEIPAPVPGGEDDPRPLGKLYSVAVSPNGLYLAVGGETTVTVFNMRTRHVVGLLTGHLDPVRALAFNEDGTRLLTGSVDTRVIVWTVPQWRRIHTFRAHGRAIADIAVQPGTGRIATASFENAIKLWPAGGQGEATVLTGHGKWVTALAFSPEGHQLASASADGAVRYWNVATGQATGQAPTSHTGPINALAYNSTGRLLATGGDDRTVQLIAIGLPKRFLVDRTWIDWQARATTAPPFPLSSLEVLSETPIPAGQDIALRVRIRNTGHDDLFRVKGLLGVGAAGDSQTPLYFGRIAAGEEVVRDFLLPTDPRWGVRETSLSVSFREANGVAPATVQQIVALDPRPHPRMVALVLPVDDGSGKSAGNGDGAIQENEGIDLHIRIRNEGQGPATGNQMRLGVDGHKGVKLFADTLALGDLAPGETAQGVITMQVLDAGSGKLRLELAVQEGFWNEAWTGVVELPIGEPTSRVPQAVSREGTLAAGTELRSGAGAASAVVAVARVAVSVQATAAMGEFVRVDAGEGSPALWVAADKVQPAAQGLPVLSPETISYRYVPLVRQ